MKTKILVLLTCASILTACKKEETQPTTEQTTQEEEQQPDEEEFISEDGDHTYEESLRSWEAMKAEFGDSYVYKTRFASWTGTGTITEVKVEQGVITERSYQAYEYNYDTGEREVYATYTETGVEIGSHESGADPLTIDALYSSCLGTYLSVDETHNSIYFRTTKDGLMTTCGFVPHDCSDDCFDGISIDYFEWLEE